MIHRIPKDFATCYNQAVEGNPSYLATIPSDNNSGQYPVLSDNSFNTTKATYRVDGGKQYFQVHLIINLHEAVGNASIFSQSQVLNPGTLLQSPGYFDNSTNLDYGSVLDPSLMQNEPSPDAVLGPWGGHVPLYADDQASRYSSFQEDLTVEYSSQTAQYQSQNALAPLAINSDAACSLSTYK